MQELKVLVKEITFHQGTGTLEEFCTTEEQELWSKFSSGGAFIALKKYPIVGINAEHFWLVEYTWLLLFFPFMIEDWLFLKTDQSCGTEAQVEEDCSVNESKGRMELTVLEEN